MERAVKEASIRRLARTSRGGRDTVLWSRHAISRLAMAALSRSAVEDALTNCEVIEDYPAAHRPLPDCLVLALLEGGSLSTRSWPSTSRTNVFTW